MVKVKKRSRGSEDEEGSEREDSPIGDTVVDELVVLSDAGSAEEEPQSKNEDTDKEDLNEPVAKKSKSNETESESRPQSKNEDADMEDSNEPVAKKSKSDETKNEARPSSVRI